VRSLQLLVMVLIGAGAFYLTFKGIDTTAFLAALAQVNLLVFALGLLCFFAVHLGRSIRWGLLVQATDPKVSFRSYFSICSVGFFLINVLPFRLGELVRPYLLYEREEVAFGSGVATVVVERVLDIAALGVIFLGVVAFADLPEEPLQVRGQSVDIITAGRRAILGVGIPSTLGLLALMVVGEPVVVLARRIAGLLGSRVETMVGRLLETFLASLQALGTPGRALPVLAWTLVTWTVNVLSVLVMAKSLPFGAGLGFWEGGAILSSICVFLIVPAPPLFAGVFELAVFVGVLLVVHDGGPQLHDEARAFSVLVHGSQFAMLSVLGIFFLLVDRISVQRVFRAMDDLRLNRAKPDGSPPA
jgi:glycosyltransferase 2 family protein